MAVAVCRAGSVEWCGVVAMLSSKSVRGMSFDSATIQAVVPSLVARAAKKVGGGGAAVAACSVCRIIIGVSVMCAGVVW